MSLLENIIIIGSAAAIGVGGAVVVHDAIAAGNNPSSPQNQQPTGTSTQSIQQEIADLFAQLQANNANSQGMNPQGSGAPTILFPSQSSSGNNTALLDALLSSLSSPSNNGNNGGSSNTQPATGYKGPPVSLNTQPTGGGSSGSNTQPTGGGSSGSNTQPTEGGSSGSNTQPTGTAASYITSVWDQMFSHNPYPTSYTAPVSKVGGAKCIAGCGSSASVYNSTRSSIASSGSSSGSLTNLPANAVVKNPYGNGSLFTNSAGQAVGSAYTPSSSSGSSSSTPAASPSPTVYKGFNTRIFR